MSTIGSSRLTMHQQQQQSHRTIRENGSQHSAQPQPHYQYHFTTPASCTTPSSATSSNISGGAFSSTTFSSVASSSLSHGPDSHSRIAPLESSNASQAAAPPLSGRRPSRHVRTQSGLSTPSSAQSHRLGHVGASPYSSTHGAAAVSSNPKAGHHHANGSSMESFSNKENTHSNGPSNGSATAVHSGLAVKPEVPAAAVLVDRMKLQSYELMRLLNSYRCTISEVRALASVPLVDDADSASSSPFNPPPAARALALPSAALDALTSAETSSTSLQDLIKDIASSIDVWTTGLHEANRHTSVPLTSSSSSSSSSLTAAAAAAAASASQSSVSQLQMSPPPAIPTRTRQGSFTLPPTLSSSSHTSLLPSQHQSSTTPNDAAEEPSTTASSSSASSSSSLSSLGSSGVSSAHSTSNQSSDDNEDIYTRYFTTPSSASTSAPTLSTSLSIPAPTLAPTLAPASSVRGSISGNNSGALTRTPGVSTASRVSTAKFSGKRQFVVVPAAAATSGAAATAGAGASGARTGSSLAHLMNTPPSKLHSSQPISSSRSSVRGQPSDAMSTALAGASTAPASAVKSMLAQSTEAIVNHNEVRKISFESNSSLSDATSPASASSSSFASSDLSESVRSAEHGAKCPNIENASRTNAPSSSSLAPAPAPAAAATSSSSVFSLALSPMKSPVKSHPPSTPPTSLPPSFTHSSSSFSSSFSSSAERIHDHADITLARTPLASRLPTLSVGSPSTPTLPNKAPTQVQVTSASSSTSAFSSSTNDASTGAPLSSSSSSSTFESVWSCAPRLSVTLASPSASHANNLLARTPLSAHRRGASASLHVSNVMATPSGAATNVSTPLAQRGTPLSSSSSSSFASSSRTSIMTAGARTPLASSSFHAPSSSSSSSSATPVSSSTRSMSTLHMPSTPSQQQLQQHHQLTTPSACFSTTTNSTTTVTTTGMTLPLSYSTPIACRQLFSPTATATTTGGGAGGKVPNTPGSAPSSSFSASMFGSMAPSIPPSPAGAGMPSSHAASLSDACPSIAGDSQASTTVSTSSSSSSSLNYDDGIRGGSSRDGSTSSSSTSTSSNSTYPSLSSPGRSLKVSISEENEEANDSTSDRNSLEVTAASTASKSSSEEPLVPETRARSRGSSVTSPSPSSSSSSTSSSISSSSSMSSSSSASNVPNSSGSSNAFESIFNVAFERVASADTGYYATVTGLPPPSISASASSSSSSSSAHGGGGDGSYSDLDESMSESDMGDLTFTLHTGVGGPGARPGSSSHHLSTSSSSSLSARVGSSAGAGPMHGGGVVAESGKLSALRQQNQANAALRVTFASPTKPQQQQQQRMPTVHGNGIGAAGAGAGANAGAATGSLGLGLGSLTTTFNGASLQGIRQANKAGLLQNQVPTTAGVIAGYANKQPVKGTISLIKSDASRGSATSASSSLQGGTPVSFSSHQRAQMLSTLISLLERYKSQTVTASGASSLSNGPPSARSRMSTRPGQQPQAQSLQHQQQQQSGLLNAAVPSLTPSDIAFCNSILDACVRSMSGQGAGFLGTNSIHTSIQPTSMSSSGMLPSSLKPSTSLSTSSSAASISGSSSGSSSENVFTAMLAAAEASASSMKGRASIAAGGLTSTTNRARMTGLDLYDSTKTSGFAAASSAALMSAQTNAHSGALVATTNKDGVSDGRNGNKSTCTSTNNSGWVTCMVTKAGDYELGVGGGGAGVRKSLAPFRPVNVFGNGASNAADAAIRGVHGDHHHVDDDDDDHNDHGAAGRKQDGSDGSLDDGRDTVLIERRADDYPAQSNENNKECDLTNALSSSSSFSSSSTSSAFGGAQTSLFRADSDENMSCSSSSVDHGSTAARVVASAAVPQAFDIEYGEVDVLSAALSWETLEQERVAHVKRSHEIDFHNRYSMGGAGRRSELSSTSTSSSSSLSSSVLARSGLRVSTSSHTASLRTGLGNGRRSIRLAMETPAMRSQLFDVEHVDVMTLDSASGEDECAYEVEAMGEHAGAAAVMNGKQVVEIVFGDEEEDGLLRSDLVDEHVFGATPVVKQASRASLMATPASSSSSSGARKMPRQSVTATPSQSRPFQRGKGRRSTHIVHEEVDVDGVLEVQEVRRAGVPPTPGTRPKAAHTAVVEYIEEGDGQLDLDEDGNEWYAKTPMPGQELDTSDANLSMNASFAETSFAESSFIGSECATPAVVSDSHSAGDDDGIEAARKVDSDSDNGAKKRRRKRNPRRPRVHYVASAASFNMGATYAETPIAMEQNMKTPLVVSSVQEGGWEMLKDAEPGAHDAAAAQGAHALNEDDIIEEEEDEDEGEDEDEDDEKARDECGNISECEDKAVSASSSSSSNRPVSPSATPAYPSASSSSSDPQAATPFGLLEEGDEFASSRNSSSNNSSSNKQLRRDAALDAIVDEAVVNALPLNPADIPILAATQVYGGDNNNISQCSAAGAISRSDSNNNSSSSKSLPHGSSYSYMSAAKANSLSSKLLRLRALATAYPSAIHDLFPGYHAGGSVRQQSGTCEYGGEGGKASRSANENETEEREAATAAATASKVVVEGSLCDDDSDAFIGALSHAVKAPKNKKPASSSTSTSSSSSNNVPAPTTPVRTSSSTARALIDADAASQSDRSLQTLIQSPIPTVGLNVRDLPLPSPSRLALQSGAAARRKAIANGVANVPLPSSSSASLPRGGFSALPPFVGDIAAEISNAWMCFMMEETTIRMYV